MFLLLCFPFLILAFESSAKADVGNPVFLTGFLEQGKQKEAQELSMVSPDIGNITSYSGFFTIDKKCESNLFFWFILAQNRSWKEAPVLFWQQGGPGSSSFFGMFEELGPFKHLNSSGLTKREYSWSMENNLLIIDPPGVGYSFSDKECYTDDEAETAEGWYKALVQFYQLFPELQNNSFVLSGESYAGHTIPLYGYTIHKNNPTADVKVNLTGVLILGAWSDPISQIDYGTYYYQLGLIDDRQRDIFYDYQEQCVESITVENWEYASYNCNILTGTLYDTFVGDVNIYNFLPDTGLEEQNWVEFIQSDQVRKQLHVGNLTFDNGDELFNVLRLNIFKSVKPYVEELLEHYPMVFVNGQLDLICPYPLTVNFLRSLKWSGNTTYLNANRTRWCYGEVRFI